MIVSEGTALDFAPQSLGETVPSLSNGYFYANTGLQLSNLYATYGALYRAQPIISTLVDKIANSAARLTVKVWDLTPKAGKVQDTTSPYARLIANPSTEMSAFNFWRWTFSTYEIFGEAFWLKQRNSFGVLVNLLPMHPSRVMVQRDALGNIEYVFTLGVASAGLLRAPARDVVAFLRYNPDNIMRGMSRLEPLRSTLLNEDASRRATQSWWTKGARPSLVLTHPGEIGQDGIDRLKGSVDNRHAGADNMGGTIVLEEGMTAQVVQLSAEEMQYIESRKLNLQEGCMVYDVPPPVVHILDHATFSNITEQMRSMYRDTMAPRLEDVESILEYALRPEFFNVGERAATFSLDEVLRGDFETRATSVGTLIEKGVMKPSEARPMFDLADAGAVADRLYANAALVELGTPAQKLSITEAIPPTAAMDAEARDAIPAIAAPEPATRSAQGARRGGRPLGKKAVSLKLRETLAAEHLKELTAFFDKQRAALKTGHKNAGRFDPAAWDGDLTEVLHSLSLTTANAIGAKVASDLGGTYDGASIADYLGTNATATAKKINQTTADQIAAAFDNADESTDDNETVDGLFDGEIAARSNQISLSRVATIGGLAALVGAKLSNARTKTWVSGANPRSAHAQMNGETVGLGETFSNGMDGPGDYSGGAEEVANCNCSLDFSMEG